MQGANNRVVAFKDGKYCDFDIDEALAMERKPSIEIEEENEMISTY